MKTVRFRRHAIGLATLCVAVVCCIVFTGFAYAADTLPPSWRGLPNTTFQEWNFNSVPGMPETYSLGVPNAYVNQYGDPSAVSTNGGYFDGILLLDAGIPMFLTIPNQPSSSINGYTLVSFQMTYHQIDSYSYEGDKIFNWSEGKPAVYMHYEEPSGDNLIDALPGTLVDEHDILLSTDGDSSWRLWQSVWRVEPAQALLFRICEPFGSSGYSVVRLDDVIVDTQYVPEPSAFVALACGLVGILTQTRKRRSL